MSNYPYHRWDAYQISVVPSSIWTTDATFGYQLVLTNWYAFYRGVWKKDIEIYVDYAYIFYTNLEKCV